MITSLLVSLAIIYTSSFKIAEGSNWNYENVEEWASVSANCSGQSQSPIALTTRNSQRAVGIDIKFSRKYDGKAKVIMKNNGHSVSLEFTYSDPSSNPYLIYSSTATNSVKYNFKSIHFHWGSDNKVGSEHVIDGKRYPLEMHMIHERASNDQRSRRLLVLGFMFQLCMRTNPGIKDISTRLGEVSEPDDQVAINIRPRDIMMKPLLSNCNAFIYNGSLTTPPCSEEVQWVVYQTPLCVTQNVLQQFRKLKNEEGNPLVNNFRPLQEVNGRVVYHKYEGKCQYL